MQRAGPGRRENDRHRGRQPRTEPAAEQQRTGDVAEAGSAEAGGKADAELQMPQRLRKGGDRETAAEQQQAEAINGARSGADRTIVPTNGEASPADSAASE